MNPHAVKDLAISNSAVIVGCEDGKSLVPYYLWTDSLNVYHRHLPALKGYHYFTTSAQKPGTPVWKSSNSTRPILLYCEWLCYVCIHKILPYLYKIAIPLFIEGAMLCKTSVDVNDSLEMQLEKCTSQGIPGHARYPAIDRTGPKAAVVSVSDSYKDTVCPQPTCPHLK